MAYYFENRSEKRSEVEKVMHHMEGTPRLRAQFQYAAWGWVPKATPQAQAADMLAYEIWKECVTPRQVRDLPRGAIARAGL